MGVGARGGDAVTVIAPHAVGRAALGRDEAAAGGDVNVAGTPVPTVDALGEGKRATVEFRALGRDADVVGIDADVPLTVMSASDVRITQKSAIDAGPDDERRLPMRSHPAFGPTAAAVPRHPTSAAGSGRAPGPPRSACSGAARARPRPGPPTPPGPLSAGPENGWLTNLRRTAMLFRCLALPHAPYGTLGRGGSVPEAL